MEVIQQSVKSFNPDPVTKKIIDVTNYAIKKRTPEEKEIVQKVKLLRKVQLLTAEKGKVRK
jgi:hypothetical protein